MEDFLRYPFGALIFGGACTWRGLFSEFCGISVDTLYKTHDPQKTDKSDMQMTETVACHSFTVCDINIISL